MNFDLSDEQRMLAEQAGGLLAERSPPDRLRQLIEERADWDEPLWRQLAEMGYLSVALPAEYGGLGMTEVDLGVISEALGRANAGLPFFSSIVLAADAIALAGSDGQKSEWLPRLGSGELVGTFAYAEGEAPWNNPDLAVTFSDGRIHGLKTPVADAGIANIAVVLASSADGPVLTVVDLEQPEIARERLDSFDRLRPYYALTFDGAAAVRLEESSPATIQRLFDRAAVQAAFEAVGGAQACMTMARDYAMDRQIFGRSLASFQAIKHKLAELAVAIELARSNAYFGAWAAAEAPAELPAAAAAARLTASAAFEIGARENLQIHGGIGYTWEANCHFYYRRERTLALSLGSREEWADRLISAEISRLAEAA
jgi:acyl-CoA dehydrogenase